MAKKEEKYSIIEMCPIRNVVARFGNKWALLLIVILHEEGCCRFSQLKKMLPDISPKMLAQTLHTLEADGLINRTVYPEMPIRVEYELTETGRSLVPIIQELTQWAQAHMQSILTHRKQFEEGKSC